MFATGSSPQRYLCATLLLFSLCTLLREVTPKSDGAPKSSCTNMIPQHGSDPQTSTPPYTITPNATSIMGGDRISLLLAGDGGDIRGFFVQGKEASGEAATPIGTFFSSTHKIIGCGTGSNNAVTHTKPNTAPTLTVEWEAPSDFQGDVVFRTSVVQHYTTLWTDILSDKVSVKKRSLEEKAATPAQPADDAQDDKSTTTTTTTQPPLTGIEASMATLYDGCGESKACSGPRNCVKNKNCKFFASYTDAGNGRYEFELKGKGGGNRFVAVGLSEDERMGDDSVVVCGSHNSEVDVYMTWNQGKTNIKVVNPRRGLRKVEAGEVDGVLYCKFLRDEMTSPHEKKPFDLKNDRFHVMIAQGPINADNDLVYHGNKNRLVSAGLVSLGSTSNLVLLDTRSLIVIHASLMIGAWICFASSGIVFARYFKQTWLQSACCNIDPWFHMHRIFMILTWCLSIAGLVIIVLVLKEFRVGYHSVIGVVAVGLCIIQPFMAALRPNPNTRYRPIFNWAHWLVGNAAHILAITAIFLGLKIFFGEERNWQKEVGWYVVVGFIAFNCLIHILLSIAQCISDRKPKNSEVFPLKEMGGSRTLLQPEDVRSDAPNGCFRKFLLALYLPVVWAFTAVLIALVVVEKEDLERHMDTLKVPQFWKEA